MREKVTVFDFDKFLLDVAKRRPVGMASSSADTLTQQQLQQLMNDPQLMELGGNLYIAKLFHYVANFTFTAASTTVTQSIQIDSDADFQLLMLLADYPSGDGADFNVNVTEGGSGGLAWMSNPVNIDLFAGSAQLPFPAGLIPQLLPKKRVYNIAVAQTSAGPGAASVQISFWGYKLFPAGEAAQVGALPTS
jgi:hypothetical protein